MKILFIGSTSGTSCSLHYFTAFSRLGHQVLPYDPQYFLPTSWAEKLWIQTKKSPFPKKIQRVHKEIVTICKKNPFDLIFVMAENFLTHVTLEEIRTQTPFPPQIVYHSHDNVFSSGILKPKDFEATLTSYDFVFTTKSQNLALYRQLGQERCFFIPSAYESTIHCPTQIKKNVRTKKFPVSFIGTFDYSRIPYLEKIGWENLYIWGSHWHNWSKYSLHRDRITPNPIYYFELSDAISNTLCNLGLLREEAGDRHTQRTFEIPACGGFQIAPRNEEILAFFSENKEIICFQSPEELVDKIQFFLAHPNEAEKIAQAGWKRCISGKHSYLDRIETILEVSMGKNLDRALL